MKWAIPVVTSLFVSPQVLTPKTLYLLALNKAEEAKVFEDLNSKMSLVQNFFEKSKKTFVNPE